METKKEIFIRLYEDMKVRGEIVPMKLHEKIDVSLQTIYRWIAKYESGKFSSHHWRNIEPNCVKQFLEENNGATLEEIVKALNICEPTARKKLKKIGARKVWNI